MCSSDLRRGKTLAVRNDQTNLQYLKPFTSSCFPKTSNLKPHPDIMDLTIHQNCPSCGAGIELHEADRLIRCPYCEVKNFMVTRGPLRFLLPDKAPWHIERSEMFYAPYLRFKGNIYYCKGKYQKYKVVDTTQQGMNARALPVSLGLRPQAMPVSLVTKEIQGTFLQQTVKAKHCLSGQQCLQCLIRIRLGLPSTTGPILANH